MRRTVFFCDRCGEQINGKIFQIGHFLGRHDCPEDLWALERVAELCEECFYIVEDATALAIRNQEPKEEGKEDEKKEDPKQTKQDDDSFVIKKRLDMGKIRALRAAGWTYDKIGAEMGVSGNTIANHLRAMEKKKAEEEG